MITHIIFSGGGIKGICYLGILRYIYIEKLIDNIKYISGSSIGAFFTVVLALRIPIELLENDLLNILKEIKDNKLLSINKNSIVNLFDKNGFHDLSFLVKPIIDFLKKNYDIEDITFLDFIKKTGINIYINATNINTGNGKIFSAENTPNVSVIKTIIASMTVPILFESIKLDDEYYVDGALSCDMPIDIFKDVNKNNILGCLLMQSNNDKLTIYPKNTDFNFIQYIYRIITIMMSNIIFQSSIKYYENESYILKLEDLPYDSTFKFNIIDDNINIELNENDMDNLILKGFIDISNHMNNRK